MKYLLKLFATTILALSSMSAMSAFDINDISTAGFYVQNQLNVGYAATANSNDHFVDDKTGLDVYPIDIEVNDSSETFLATVLVTINEGEVTQLRCNEGQDLTKLGITCDGTYTVKSGFFSDWAKMGFAAANEIANQKHIDAVLNVEGSKAYTIFAGDVYINAGEVTASVSLREIKGKTNKQIEELIMASVESAYLSKLDAKMISNSIQSELKAIAEDAARLSRKVVSEVAEEVSEMEKNLVKKLKVDCKEVEGHFSVIVGGWACTGWGTNPTN